MEIREIGDWWIYVVLYLYQGKVIDIVRQKIAKIDYDKDSLLANLSALYTTSFDEHNGLYLHLSKSFKKAEETEIRGFLQRCFESFVVSTSFEQENLLNDCCLP